MQAEPVVLNAASGITTLKQTDVSSGTLTLTGGNSYQLAENVSVSSTIEVTGTVTLDLNGRTLSTTGSGPVIRVEKGGNLTLCDSGSGGAISGGNCTDKYGAGGVYVSGTFNMTGGAISGCTYTGSTDDFKFGAGGVYVGYKGTFSMSGGAISGCTANVSGCAGGVLVSTSGKFTMSGGTISNCTTNASGSAGGVYVGSAAEFTMSGGTITQCKHNIQSSSAYDDSSYSGAGAVFVLTSGKFTMSGSNTSITSCFAVNQDEGILSGTGRVAGGVYNKGIFTMNGGECTVCCFYMANQNSPQVQNFTFDSALVNVGTMYANGGTMCGLVNSGQIQTQGSNATSFCLQIEKAGFVKLSLSNRGEICGGRFDSAVYNEKTISGGTFNYEVENYGSISDGTFNGKVSNFSSRTISGGTFNGEVGNSGTISGGTFKGIVVNKTTGTVQDGDFSSATRTNVCQISFDLNGGAGTVPATQWRYNHPATEPTAPTRTGYKFLGWYNGDSKWNFETKVTSAEDIMLMAKWEPLPKATVTTAPTANSLTYNGTAQELVSAGTVASGTVCYKLGESGTWGTAIPKATAAGDYTVYYYVKGDGITCNDSDVSSVAVTIAQKSVTATVSVETKTYDGTTDATVSATVDASELIAGDSITIGGLTGSFADANAGTDKAVTIHSANKTITGAENYSVTIPTEATGTIESKAVATPTVTVAAGTYTYSGAEQKPTVTVKDGNTVIPASEYDVAYSANINAGTATVTVTNRSGGNYTLSEAGATFTIAPRPVTLTSADSSKPYDGTALTNTTATASGMVAGEAFGFDFTGTQTAIGSAENKFTAKPSATAKLTNYDITYNYGTLTVTVPTDVAAPVENLTQENVKAGDRETIENTLDTVEDYLDMAPSEAEKSQLGALKEKLESLLEQIDEVQEALEDDKISKVEDITADNATASDKEDLEQAKEAIEEILDDFSGNLTEQEKSGLEQALAQVDAALNAIDQDDQGDQGDRDDQGDQGKQDGQTKPEQQVVKTGDKAMPMLWLALAAMSALGIAVVAKKKVK